MPWTLSSRGYGVLLENDERSTFHMGAQQPGVWSAEPQAPTVSVRVFPGPTPAPPCGRFTAATGRQPRRRRPRGRTARGFRPASRTSSRSRTSATWIELLQDADAPVSVGETQMHYLPCGANTARPRAESRSGRGTSTATGSPGSSTSTR